MSTQSDSGPSDITAVWGETDDPGRVDEVPTEPRAAEPKVVVDAGFTPPPDLDDPLRIEVGAQIGHYVVLEKLGSGGMCDVFAVYDRDLARKAAIKVVRPLNTKQVTPVEVHRLLREAQTMAQVAHPNVVTVFEIGMVGARPYVAMEYVPGQTLRRWMRRDRSWQETIRVFCEAGEGLIAAHEQGVIHRDFKPDNVLLSDKGRVQVTDFGLADIVQPRVDANLDADDVVTFATQNGLVFGTPAYMPPEQMRGEKADPRADQFSYCVALYEALYDRPPFLAGKISTRHQQILAGHIQQPPKDSPIPRRVFKIIARGLSGDPDLRYPSMEALIRDLGRAATAGRRRAAAAAITLGSLAAVVLGLFVSSATKRSEVCEGAQEQWVGVWDGEVRAARRRAFERLESGAQVWSQIEQQLDAHTTRWNSAFAENCRATRIQRGQAESIHDLRRACLERGKREVEALVSLFADPDDNMVRNAQPAVHNLTDPEQCSPLRVSFVVDRQHAGSSDRAARERVQKLIATATAHFNLGQFTEALELARSAADSSEKAGIEDLGVDALYLIGKAQWRSDRLTEAEETLVLACARATSIGHSWLRAECLTDLVYVVGVERVDFNQARHWFQMASQSIKALGEPKILRGELLQSWATALGTHGDLKEGAAMAHQAFQDLTDALPASNARLGRAYNAYGNHLYYAGDLPKALEVYRQGLEIRTATLHPDHPEIAESLNNMANVLNDMGMPDAALEMHGKALDIYQRAGDQKVEIAKSLSNIGLILLGMGKPREAREHFTRSLQLEREVRGENHPYVAVTFAMLGAAHEALGEIDRAEAAYRQAVSSIDKAPPGSETTIETIDALEMVYQFHHRKRAQKAVEWRHRAAISFRLAKALVAAGKDRARARELAEESIRSYLDAGGESQGDRRAVAMFLAEEFGKTAPTHGPAPRTRSRSYQRGK